MNNANSHSALRIADMTVKRSGLPVVRNVSMDVLPGSITVLLGANGAGKTSLLEGISGAIKSVTGSVHMGDVVLHAMPAHARARHGLAHVEQGRTVFAGLTTEENLIASAGPGAFEEAVHLFPELEKRQKTDAAMLSGGEQQMVCLARAWLRKPKFILIDELSLGLAPKVTQRLMEGVIALAGMGAGVLLVEQFAEIALSAGETAYFLRSGEMVHHGPAAELRENPHLLNTLYLGASEPAAANGRRA